MPPGRSTNVTTERKRGNITGACAHCRRRKVRCTGERPVCGPCQQSDIVCTWGPSEEDARKPASRRYVQSLQDKILSLEALLKAQGDAQLEGLLLGSELGMARPNSPPSSDTEDGIISSNLLHLQIGIDREEINCHDPSSAFAHLTTLNDNNPFAPPNDRDTKANGFRRFLPPAPTVQLSLAEHDTMLESFFTFFSAWTLRTSPDQFKRDMFRCVSSWPNINLSRYSMYSPFLHNAILSWALCLAEDHALRDPAARAPYVQLAERHLQTELDHPCLATVQGLGILSSVYSSLGHHTLGWSYMGLAERLVLSMGLNVTCRPLVLAGKISEEESRMRNHTYWTIFCQEQFWSIFIGRPHVPQRYNTELPLIDPIIDGREWWTRDYVETPARPGRTSTAFYYTCKLSLLIARVMTTLYHFHPNRSVLSSQTLTSLGLALDEWIQDLPPYLHVNAGSERNALPHIIILQLAREIVTMMIYRPFYQLESDALSLEEKNSVIRRCDRSALRATALLRLYRSTYGLRFVVPFMMIATYISGTTHLMRATRSKSNSTESGHIQEAQQCVDIMRQMSTTFTVAARKADLLQTAIHQSIDNDAQNAPERQVVSTGKIDSPIQPDIFGHDMSMHAETLASTLVPMSSSVSLLPPQPEITLDFLAANAYPNLDLTMSEAEQRADHPSRLIVREMNERSSTGSGSNLWLWDFQVSPMPSVPFPTGVGGVPSEDEHVETNPFDWPSDVFGA